MANLSLIRVNQKLAQAKLLIADIDEEAITPIHCNSLMEAVAFHLVCAYQHYLHELTETYGLKYAVAIRTESDLAKAFEAAAKYPAEADELILLRSDNNSWLAQLHTYYDSLWQAPKSVALDDNNLIDIVNLDAPMKLSSLTLDLVRGWCDDFVSLIARQRETSAEF